ACQRIMHEIKAPDDVRPDRAQHWCLYAGRKTSLTLIAQIQPHSSVNTVNTFVVPHILQLPQPVVHHPEPPCPVEFGKNGQLFDDFTVVLALSPVVIYRCTDTKQHTGLT